jgi:hypothetical protein
LEFRQKDGGAVHGRHNGLVLAFFARRGRQDRSTKKKDKEKIRSIHRQAAPGSKYNSMPGKITTEKNERENDGSFLIPASGGTRLSELPSVFEERSQAARAW